MRVIRAEAMGMCFGVRDALRALDGIERPKEVTIHGEIVHNGVVLERLRARGFRMSAESDRERLPDTPDVLVTAHGLSDTARRRLADAGKRLLDTTCPLVRRAHDAAKALAAEGRHVIVVGRPGHVEVEGLIGDLPSCSVVPGPGAAAARPESRLGIVFQTTTPVDLARETVAAVRRANPDAAIRVLDTVCRPTKERQAALLHLMDAAECLVVVGGRNSNNTRALVTRARDCGRPAFHVTQAADLRPGWFAGTTTVGLTAGTSTLPETIDAVEAALLAIPEREALTGASAARTMHPGAGGGVLETPRTAG
jgi:4-hydroxy-3-methylbut-2-enyl diphosphate reductase